LGHERKEFKLHSERTFSKKIPLQFQSPPLTENFPSKAEREASTDRISQFQEPSLRKNPHFYTKFFLAREGAVPYLIHKQPANKVHGCFFFFLGLG
jgi:hypothetical protein